MRNILLIILSLLLFSCEEEENVPDYVLSVDKFAEVLTDFQTAEAIVRLGYNRTKDSLTYNDSIYSAVFRKHDISKYEFDSNYTYYSNQPKVFEAIYEEVITKLSERSAEIQGSKKE